MWHSPEAPWHTTHLHTSHLMSCPAAFDACVSCCCLNHSCFNISVQLQFRPFTWFAFLDFLSVRVLLRFCISNFINGSSCCLSFYQLVLFYDLQLHLSSREETTVSRPHDVNGVCAVIPQWQRQEDVVVWTCGGWSEQREMRRSGFKASELE